MFGQDCGQAPFISKHTRPRCSGELCLLCWVTDTNMIFKQVQLYLFLFSCSTCMSTVLAKAAHSLYFWAATPKIPTAFYFDKQNQHVFAEFKQENCPRKNKTVKKYQQFEPNCWPNCWAIWENLASLCKQFVFWCTIMTWAERTMMCVWFFWFKIIPKHGLKFLWNHVLT